MRILYSAYACEPGTGSEYGVGWNVPLAMAEQYPEVQVCVLTRSRCREKIEGSLAARGLSNLKFFFYDVPRWLYYKKEIGSRWGEQYNYLMWQLMVRGYVKNLIKREHIDVFHHITFNQYRTPSPGFFIDIPFVLGPVGGAETISPSFECDLSQYTIAKENVRRKGRDLPLFGWWTRRKRNTKYILCSTQENLSRLSKYVSAYPLEVYPAIGFLPGDFSGITQSSHTETFEMLYAGKALDWKGVKILLHAVSKAFEETGITDFRVKLVGIRFEDEQKQVNEWISAYGLEEHVILVPFMERARLLALLSNAALSVYPAFRDSGSMSVLEASVLACPTICFDAGGQDAFPDDTLLKVEVTDSYEANLDAFAQRLLWAYRNREKLAAVGARAQKYAYEHLTWKSKVAHFMDIYKGLVKPI